MAQYNGNAIYLDLDGTVVHSWFINVNRRRPSGTGDGRRHAFTRAGDRPEDMNGSMNRL